MNINSPFQLGSLTLPHRLIQGPLAGYSCAPYRVMFSLFQAPAYCVSEMISAQDLLQRQPPRFVSRAPQEQRLCYQLSGDNPQVIAAAASYLAGEGADLIDLNCGCPKAKIRKKGAGSALLSQPERLLDIVATVKSKLAIPLTVKIRIQGTDDDLILASAIAAAGADGLIVHGRRWQDGYDKACDAQQIARIKAVLKIPVIANGDIADRESLKHLMQTSGCDAYMISRAGTGQPWLYQQLLTGVTPAITLASCVDYFMLHLQGLALLQNEHQAVLQSKTLVRYYFRPWLQHSHFTAYYALDSLAKIEQYLRTFDDTGGYDSRST